MAMPLLRAPSGARRGFTLIELLVALGIVAVMAAVAGSIYSGIQRKSNDNIAIGLADQLASNFGHYAAITMSGYPANLSGVTWQQAVGALGQYAEFPSTTPSIFTGAGGLIVWTDSAGSTFQIAFRAAGGTGTVYCRDPNGLAAIGSLPSSGGPWSGCP
jgi:prepilin-type N-terminal cleavage/methylation domain-containing protein